MPSLFHRRKGQGPPIIFIHGFCETSEIWEPLFEEIDAGQQLISVDLPGFGKTESLSENFTIDEVAKILVDWITSNNIIKPILVGHSLGGYITLSMLKQEKALFSAAVLFHSTARPDAEEKKQSRLKVIEFVQSHGLKAFIENFIPSLFFNSDIDEVKFALKIAHNTDETTFKSYTLAMRERPSSENILRSLRIPMLIIAGEKDAIIPMNDLLVQANLNPKIQLHVLKNVGHMGMLEAKKEAAYVLKQFAAKVSIR